MSSSDFLPWATLFGPLFAVLGGVILNQRYAHMARAEHVSNQIAIAAAAESASKAAAAAAIAARQLIESAKITSVSLTQISKVTDATHNIVNGERTLMRTEIARLLRRISDDNPNDFDARVEADLAEEAINRLK